MKLAIHQPNYLPWLGYFRKIGLADVFVFFDNAIQPRGKSYVSRNEIRTEKGRQWLTVPIIKKQIPISETPIVDQHWVNKHLGTLRHAYAASPHAEQVLAAIVPALERGHEKIADLNIALIESLSGLIGLDTRFVRASMLGLSADGAASIPEIIRGQGASTYITGSGAGSLRSIDPDEMAEMGVALEILNTDFAPYTQLFEPFEANLSILDALFCLGPHDTRRLLFPE